MTKKDYIKIAKAINNSKNCDIAETKNGGLAFLIGQLAEQFKIDNPNFNKAKFFKACDFDHFNK